MQQENIKRIIDETVNATVLKLKMTGLLKDNRKTAFQKTEELLRNYQTFKYECDGGDSTKKLIEKIDQALKNIEDDIYYDIIPMIYFNNCTREEVADYFNTSTKTVTRNKIRLINELKLMLFSDDVIFELFL